MSFDPEEYAGQSTVADDPKPERCNQPHCNHADDDELGICDSCPGKTCGGHAVRYKFFVLCRNCGAKELAAKTTARRALMSLDMSAMDAGQIADTLRSIADTLESWDVEVPA